jgi:hypothetical protein
MSAFAGSQLYLAWVYPGGTQTLTGDFRTFSWTPNLNWIDATAGADTFEEMLPSYGTGSDITCTMVMQVGGTAILAALDRQTFGTLVYGPEGNTTGMIKYSIPATSAGPSYNQPYNDIVEVTATFRQRSAETRGAF